MNEILRQGKKSICDEAKKAYVEYELTAFAKACVDLFIKHVEGSDEDFFAADVQAGTLSIFGRYVQSVVEECPKKGEA